MSFEGLSRSSGNKSSHETARNSREAAKPKKKCWTPWLALSSSSKDAQVLGNDQSEVVPKSKNALGPWYYLSSPAKDTQASENESSHNKPTEKSKEKEKLELSKKECSSRESGETKKSQSPILIKWLVAYLGLFASFRPVVGSFSGELAQNQTYEQNREQFRKIHQFFQEPQSIINSKELQKLESCLQRPLNQTGSGLDAWQPTDLGNPMPAWKDFIDLIDGNL